MDKSPPRRDRYRAALISLSISTLLSALGTSVANVALPSLARAFEAPFHVVQWVVVTYVLAVTIVVVTAGRLGDFTGRKRLLVAGIALFALASAACAAAPDLRALIAARAAQGIGAAIMLTLATALIADAVPAARSGSAMGMLGTMSAVGTALGPSLGGVLIAGLGWRSIFAVNALLALVALGLASRYLPPDGARSAKPMRFNWAGSALLAITLATYALGATVHGTPGMNATLFVAAAAVGAAFVVIDLKAPSPVMPWRILRGRAIAGGLAASIFVSTVVMATLVVGPFYLSAALGLDPVMVGLSMSVGPAVVAVTGVPAGLIVDRVGPPRVVFAGLVAMVLGCVALSVSSAGLGAAGYVVPLAMTTLGYSLFQTANNTAIMATASPQDRGAVSGLLNLSRNLGLVTGASVMGTVFALASGSRDPASSLPEAVSRGMHGTFAVAALLAACAIAVRFARADWPPWRSRRWCPRTP